MESHKFGMQCVACMWPPRPNRIDNDQAGRGSDERALSPPGGEGASSLVIEGWAY